MEKNESFENTSSSEFKSNKNLIEFLEEFYEEEEEKLNEKHTQTREIEDIDNITRKYIDNYKSEKRDFNQKLKSLTSYNKFSFSKDKEKTLESIAKEVLSKGGSSTKKQITKLVSDVKKILTKSDTISKASKKNDFESIYNKIIEKSEAEPGKSTSSVKITEDIKEVLEQFANNQKEEYEKILSEYCNFLSNSSNQYSEEINNYSEIMNEEHQNLIGNIDILQNRQDIANIADDVGISNSVSDITNNISTLGSTNDEKSEETDITNNISIFDSMDDEESEGLSEINDILNNTDDKTLQEANKQQVEELKKQQALLNGVNNIDAFDDPSDEEFEEEFREIQEEINQEAQEEINQQAQNPKVMGDNTKMVIEKQENKSQSKELGDVTDLI